LIDTVKNIAVVGHLVWDRIVKPDGSIIESLGGIAYSLTALASVAPKGYRIYPICNTGNDLRPEIRKSFESFANIDLSLIRQIPRRNKVHQLTYKGAEYRKELNIGEMPLIRPSLFGPIRKWSVIWLNYIGGDEFPPRFINEIKTRYKPLIYLDYHSLSLGKKIVDKKKLIAERFFRLNSHWRDYTGLADIVQMNHVELQSLFPEVRYDDTDSIIRYGREVLDTGPRIVIVTREEREIVVLSGRGAKPKIDIIQVKPIKAIDPTGCGDSLGAGFIANYIKDNNILKACQNGLSLAMRKAGFSGLKGFTKFGSKS